MKRRIVLVVAGLFIGFLIGAAMHWHAGSMLRNVATGSKPGSSELDLIKNPRTPADKIVNGAKMEVIRGVTYDASYVKLSYPNGDVPKDRGACTDVVVRALRNAGYDLQKLIHEDKTDHPGDYPLYGGQTRPDPNIDHRRVPNQMAFFRRHGLTLPKETTGTAAATWQPGDIIYWKLPWNHLDHSGVCSNVRDERGLPLVIHNIGSATQADVLDEWPIQGHFRYPASSPRRS